MLRGLLALTLLATAPLTLAAQWTLHDTHTTADLRGIDNVGGGVAWASGSHGTILRTEDTGIVWQLCAKPPGGENLDFRAIQAFDNSTAIIMSIGKGDQSRLYKTTDGCQSWTLLFTNPDKAGFFDNMKFADRIHGFILGDPVLVPGSTNKRVVFKQTIDGGKTWISWERTVSDFARGDDAGAFAASNSGLIAQDRFHAVVAIGGKGGSAVGFPGNNEFPTNKEFCGASPSTLCPTVTDEKATRELNVWWTLGAPFPETESGGIFSIAQLDNRIVAVGGDYKEPQSSEKTAAYTAGGPGDIWHASTTPPHGFRSAVAYDSKTKTWITVGPNGTDISSDDGVNWHALHPDPAFNEAPDADQHWNALSLPYVVGPHGRIGTLRPSALTPAK